MEKGVNGKMAGDANADLLRTWLDGVQEIPTHRDGTPNQTEIARLAKLADRQPLKNNEECKRLLALALETKGHAAVSREDEKVAVLERRLRSTEIRADKEIAENFELKRQLKRLLHIEKIIESGGRPVL